MCQPVKRAVHTGKGNQFPSSQGEEGGGMGKINTPRHPGIKIPDLKCERLVCERGDFNHPLKCKYPSLQPLCLQQATA